MHAIAPISKGLAQVAGGLGLLVLAGLIVLLNLDEDVFDEVCVLGGVTIILFVNCWALYAHAGQLGTFKIFAPIAGALVPLTLLCLGILDWDDFAVIFGPVGAVLGLEVIVWQIWLAAPPARGDGPMGGRAASRNRFSLLLRRVPPWLNVFLQMLGGLILLFLLDLGAGEAGQVAGLAFGALLLLLNGWAVYAFVRYRQGRQDELVQVLAAAVAGGLPLASTVRAYVSDRPRRSDFRKAMMGLACFALPLYTYTRICIGWRRYDDLIGALARRLEAGESLSTALRSVPGVAARSVQLLAAIGEATDSLGLCLQAGDRKRWTAAWLEVAPRFVYPFVVFLIVLNITAFMMIAIIPKFKRIFDDFGMRLPPQTRALVDVSTYVADYTGIIPLALLLGLVALATVIANPATRWHAPVLGRLYRWGIQATVLRALGRMFAAGWTAPRALALLDSSDDLPPVVRRRLETAREAVEDGEPLDESLQQAELLSPALAPLVRAAERARTLPWALSELGDQLAGQAFRRVRRISLVAGPLMIVAIAALVAFIALGLFMPLIELLSGLVQ